LIAGGKSCHQPGMRNPDRKAVYCFLALLMSGGLIRFGAVRLERFEEDLPGAGAIALGCAIVPFALYTLIEALFAIRGRALLLLGRDVIARWRVHPAEWNSFRALDSRRSGEDVSLGNDLWIRRPAPAGPVEVIVGARSALVDGSYHSLKPGGLPELRGVSWLEGPPACLEFELRYPRGRHGPPVPTTLRIPVPAGARAEASRVFEHFDRATRPRPAVALPDRPRRYRAFWVIVPAAAAAGGIGYVAFPGLSDGARELILPGLAIGASVLAIFATAIALAMYLFPPRT
jgi:hypothetical protein